MSPSGPVGYFIIDSLDSLHIAGMMDEYKRARDWVVENVKFEQLDDKFHTFEVSLLLPLSRVAKIELIMRESLGGTDHDSSIRWIVECVPSGWGTRYGIVGEGEGSGRSFIACFRYRAFLLLSLLLGSERPELMRVYGFEY